MPNIRSLIISRMGMDMDISDQRKHLIDLDRDVPKVIGPRIAEGLIKGFLSNKLDDGERVFVHVWTVNPLQVMLKVVDKDTPDPPIDWWDT